MAAQHGKASTLAWGTPPVTLQGIRVKNITRTAAPIDITTGEDSGNRTLLADAAQVEYNISVSGITKSETLASAFLGGSSTRTKALTLTLANGRSITGNFYLASYNETAAYNDAVTFEAEFQSTGAVTETAGT